MRNSDIGSLEVSVVGLGCNNFGRALNPEESADVVEAALDAGITFFDTSDNYGEGRSEAYLGQALGSRRSSVVIATKFGMPVAGVADTGGARPDYIMRAVERSLRQLGTEWIDLYQLHKPDPTTPIDDTFEALSKLIESGKVREIGCSNLDAQQTASAASAAQAGGWPVYRSNQVEYSLLHRQPEANGVLTECRNVGMSLLPFYPLANGLLTGKLRRGEAPTGRLGMDRYQSYLTDRNFAIVDELRDFVAARSLSMAQVAIGWLLANPQVPAVTAGATTASQVAANAKAADWLATPADLIELDSVTRSTAADACG